MTRKFDTTDSPSMLRQQWLETAGAALRERYAGLDYPVPAAVRLSIGWPKGSRDGKLAIGQCWSLDSSTDKHSEIFISPALGHMGQRSTKGSVKIIGVLAHEFAHAICGNKAGHKRVSEKNKESFRKSFPACAGAVGLLAPWTATGEGPDFTNWAESLIKSRLDLFPAGALLFNKTEPKGSRMLKCQCPEHKYIARVTRTWVELSPPLCPLCPGRNPMVCEDVGGEEGEDE